MRKTLEDYDYNQNTSERFNMNIAWLIKIDRLITYFTMARLDEDIEQMYNSLELLEAVTSPKVDNDEVEKNLKWLNENKGGFCVFDYSGAKEGEIASKKKEIVNVCMVTFKLIMQKLQKSGILTYIAGDPGKAMGNFG